MCRRGFPDFSSYIKPTRLQCTSAGVVSGINTVARWALTQTTFESYYHSSSAQRLGCRSFHLALDLFQRRCHQSRQYHSIGIFPRQPHYDSLHATDGHAVRCRMYCESVRVPFHVHYRLLDGHKLQRQGDLYNYCDMDPDGSKLCVE